MCDQARNHDFGAAAIQSRYSKNAAQKSIMRNRPRWYQPPARHVPVKVRQTVDF
jgi:hypothetical protein